MKTALQSVCRLWKPILTIGSASVDQTRNYKCMISNTPFNHLAA